MFSEILARAHVGGGGGNSAREEGRFPEEQGVCGKVVGDQEKVAEMVSGRGQVKKPFHLQSFVSL